MRQMGAYVDQGVQSKLTMITLLPYYKIETFALPQIASQESSINFIGHIWDPFAKGTTKLPED